MFARTILFITLLACLPLQAHSLELIREKIDLLLEQINDEQKIIEDGLSLGSRKDALRELRRIKRQQIPFIKDLEDTFFEKIEDKNFQIIRAEALLDQANQKLSDRNELIGEQFKLIEQLRDELEARPPRGREYICSLNVFRRTYIGTSQSEEVAKSQALMSCAEDYDLNLQCRRGTLRCALN